MSRSSLAAVGLTGARVSVAICAFAIVSVGQNAGAFTTSAPAAPRNCRVESVRHTNQGGYQPSILITWKDRSANEDGFTVERHFVFQGETYVASWNVYANTTSTTYSSYFGLDGDYRVRAFNGFGVSAWSNWATYR